MSPLPALSSLLLLIFFSSSLHHSLPPACAAATAGFSVELIHGDSPLSPFYNASQTMLDRNLAALQRSNSRARYLSRLLSRSSTSTHPALLMPSATTSMEYLMRLSIGTPPLKLLAVVDTSSSLIWTQSPCKTSSFRALSCQSKPCSALLPQQRSCGKERECMFHYSYDDEEGRYSDGVLAMDAFALPSPKELAFGCTMVQQGSRRSDDGVSIALVGLGPEPLSLAAQLASSTQATFSYCLVPRSESKPMSVLSFGDKASIAAGKDVLSTPIKIAGKSEPLRLLTLQSISLGNMHFPVWPPKKPGRTIIDPGTLFSYLPDLFLHEFTEELADVLAAEGNEPAGIHWGPLNVCYLSNGESEFSGAEMTLRFEGGANMTVGKTQSFIQVTEDVACLAWLPSGDPELAILGSLAQQDFHTVYDLNQNKLSFAPAQCANLI